MALKIVFLAILIIGLASAYPYHDFTWESLYHSPEAPPDSLLGNCNRLVGSGFCGYISNLTPDQQKGLILDGINPDANYPNYSFVQAWNSNLSFSKFAPFGTVTHNSGSIRDAWVKIVDLWPSVTLNNQTLLNNTGNITTEFEFSFVVPNRLMSGDCRTDYLPQGYDYQLGTFLNGVKINSGSSKQANYSLNFTNNTFTSILNVQSNYFIKHYHWVTHCDPSGCWISCDYYRTDNIVDHLNISDSKNTSLYNFTDEVKSIVDWQQNNLTDFWYSVNLSNDFANYLFQSGNSTITVRGVRYNLKYDNSPYDTLSYEAVPIPKQNYLYGLTLLNQSKIDDNSTYLEKDNLLFPTEGNCTFEVGSHFQEFQYLNFCNLTNETPNLELNLVNRSSENITIEISFSQDGIPLTGKNILVSYGSFEQNVTTDTSGNATIVLPASGNGIVVAQFITDLQIKSAKTVFVIPPETPDFEMIIFAVLSSLLLLYLAYKILGRFYHEK